MKHIILTLTIFLFFFGCVNNQTSLEKEIHGPVVDSVIYNKIEIYCYCFALMAGNSMSISNGASCGGNDQFDLKNVISPKHYYDSILDTKKINNFIKLIFNNNHRVESVKNIPTPRFVLLLKRNNLISDTVILDRYKSLNFNGKTLFTYPFYVMDSIRLLIDKPTITCDLFPAYSRANSRRKPF